MRTPKLTALFVCSLSIASSLLHPAIPPNEQQISAIRTELSLGPSSALFDAIKALRLHPRSSLRSPKSPSTVRCGKTQEESAGCVEDREAADAALLQAYLWVLVGQSVYATGAVDLLNSFTRSFTRYTGRYSRRQAGAS
jgi:hypothetical protein